jgi:hypothetical protein
MSAIACIKGSKRKLTEANAEPTSPAKVARPTIATEADAARDAAPPVWYAVSVDALTVTMRSTESTEAERAAARSETHRRELICGAILEILVGGYDDIAYKWRHDCGFNWFGSTFDDVRAKSMREIAQFAFSEEEGAVLCAALAAALRDGFKVPASVTLEDIQARPLRAVCGLSTTRGPVLLHRRQYFEQVVSNVNAIVGNALKERLCLISPEWVLD